MYGPPTNNTYYADSGTLIATEPLVLYTDFYDSEADFFDSNKKYSMANAKYYRYSKTRSGGISRLSDPVTFQYHQFQFNKGDILGVIMGQYINLPFQCKKSILGYILNLFMHAIVDDLKANDRVINLCIDQLLHILQIVATYVALLH